MVINVGVLGAKGRMGQEVISAVKASSDMSLVAALDIGDSLEALVKADAKVVVDFTTPDSVMDNLKFLITNGIHAVVGTTGFDPARISQLELLQKSYPEVAVLIAPNFALGAVLMMQFSKTAAKYFESVEIVELHHPEKVDAPSGTSVRTAEIIAQSRREANASPMPDATKGGPDGARGASVEGIPIHSLRIRGLVAHQEVLFGSVGDLLTIRHDSPHRSGFMPGVLLAIREITSHPGISVGLEKFLTI